MNIRRVHRLAHPLTQRARLRTELRTGLLSILVVLVVLPFAAGATRPGWERKEVDGHMTGGSRIKAVSYPEDRPVPLGTAPKKLKAASSQFATTSQEKTGPLVFVNTIDSPPLFGFVPWVVVALTDERLDEFEIDANPWTYVVGNYLTASPEADYTIGILDTGAGIHLISYAGAVKMGLYGHSPDLITSNVIQIAGATGIVDIWVSQPIGFFIDGLGAVESSGLLNHSWMVGETNVSVGVGDADTSPLIPTVVGTPVSVYFSTLIRNDKQVTVIHDGNEYTGPDVRVYDLYDSAVPLYSNTVPLELRPADVYAVQYIPDYFNIEDPSPLTPSIITGFLSTQSLFFIASVDLTNGSRSAIDKDGFMFDTGAQVSVISNVIATRLSLNLDSPDFEVEIMDVTGETTIQPGFYIDSIEFAASPEWLSYTNVPVVVMDIASPEGGYLDGIIGMNLFTNLNFVLHGGYLPSIAPPVIEFEYITNRLAADIAPQGGDGIVNFFDLAALCETWLATPTSANWNADADIAPVRPDEVINILDFAVLADQWLETIAP